MSDDPKSPDYRNFEPTQDEIQGVVDVISLFDPDKKGMTMKDIRNFRYMNPKIAWGDLQKRLEMAADQGLIKSEMRTPQGAKVAFQYWKLV
jgi:hypothetical protein